MILQTVCGKALSGLLEIVVVPSCNRICLVNLAYCNLLCIRFESDQYKHRSPCDARDPFDLCPTDLNTTEASAAQTRCVS